MKRLKLTLAALIISAGTFAQTGIGTTTPEASAQLDVSSTTKGFLAPRMTSVQRAAISSPATGLLVYQTDATDGYYYYNGTSWTLVGAASGSSQWTTSGSNIYYNSGNVGIGTTSPNSALEIGVASGSGWASSIRFTRAGTPNADTRIAVASDGLLFRNFDSSTSTQFSFRDYNDVHIWDLKSGGRSLFNGATDDNSYSVQIGGSNSLRTAGQAIFNGNVGIGTTSPGALLDVEGTLRSTDVCLGYGNEIWYDAAAGDGGGLYLNYRGYHGGFEYFRNTHICDGKQNIIASFDGSSGNVGIGTTTPAYPLQVYFNGDGGAYCNGSNWVGVSDKRLKRDIQPMTNYGLKEVMQLKPVSYYFKNDKTNHREVGFIAQDMLQIIPEVVHGKEGDLDKGEILGLSYGNLVPVLTKAIQEQQKEIDELKAQNAALIQKADAIDQLKAEFDNLKKMISASSIQLADSQ